MREGPGLGWEGLIVVLFVWDIAVRTTHGNPFKGIRWEGDSRFRSDQALQWSRGIEGQRFYAGVPGQDDWSERAHQGRTHDGVRAEDDEGPGQGSQGLPSFQHSELSKAKLQINCGSVLRLCSGSGISHDFLSARASFPRDSCSGSSGAVSVSVLRAHLCHVTGLQVREDQLSEAAQDLKQQHQRLQKRFAGVLVAYR